jgi:hypothetical protein
MWLIKLAANATPRLCENCWVVLMMLVAALRSSDGISANVSEFMPVYCIEIKKPYKQVKKAILHKEVFCWMRIINQVANQVKIVFISKRRLKPSQRTILVEKGFITKTPMSIGDISKSDVWAG